MQTIFPEKLKAGDEIRVVAPAQSIRPFMTDEIRPPQGAISKEWVFA